MNPPKRPNWRWLTYHALLGRDKEGVDEEILRYAKHVTRKHDDRIEDFREIGAECLLKHEKEKEDPNINRALKIREEPPIRDLLQELLLEQCELDLVQETLYHKFKETIPTEALSFYRDFFWDTETLNAYEFGQYFAESEQTRPEPPPIQGKWRSYYRIFKEGGEIDLDMNEAMARMFQRSFFRSEELSKYKAAADDRVLDYQKNAVKIFKALQKSENEEGGIEMPEEFRQTIEYPDETAVESDSLEEYNPKENPNEEEEDE